MSQKKLTKAERRLLNEAAGYSFIPFWRLSQHPQMFVYFQQIPGQQYINQVKFKRYELNDKGREAQRTGSKP